MRKLTTKILIIVLLGAAFGACDKQRDLYVVSGPSLHVEGDWVPSLGRADMHQRATAMLYRGGSVHKEYFLNPNSVTANVSEGLYGVLIFNGMMFSEEDTNLDHIRYRNTDDADTFEAFVVEAEPNRRLSRAENEFLASNDMELLTSAWETVQVTGSTDYYLKYHNGQNGYPAPEEYVGGRAHMTPHAVSYRAQVLVSLVNPSSAGIANGALRGFVGSVFMASRTPSHFGVTHQLRLNNLNITDPGVPDDPAFPERGTIESPHFVTFGPPIDLADDDTDWKYEFEISIVLKNGEVVERTFDIASQITPVIEQIRSNLDNPIMLPITLTIPINISVELPKVDSSFIGVGDWDDDEVIRVPIRS